MKRMNQKGVIGPMELGSMLVLVLVVGFVSFRIASVSSDVGDSNANAVDSSESSLVETIAVNKVSEAESKPVDIPKQEEKIEEVKLEPVKTDPVKEDETKKEEETKKDITYVSFVSNKATLSDTTISARAELKTAQTGTCYLKMYKEGQDKVIKEVSLNNAKVCEASFDTSELPVDGDWELHSWFNSEDGKVEGYASEYPITI